MPSYSPEVTNFWRGYQRLVNDRSLAPGDDFIDLNYNGEEKPAGSFSLYFRPLNIPGNLFDHPHIGYQTNRGEVVFYAPKIYCNDDAMDLIESSREDLESSGEKCTIETTRAGTVKLIIKITSIRTIETQTFQNNEDIAKLSYEKVIKLLKIARKAFPGY